MTLMSFKPLNVELRTKNLPKTVRFQSKILTSIFLTAVICALAFNSTETYAQEVYQHVTNTDIYDFLDELANGQVITLNTAIKPYSRMLIAEKLREADSKKEALNSRQQKELLFYLKDYNKELKPDKNFDKRYDLFFYKDSLFTISLNPILGATLYANDTIHNMYHRSAGAEVFAYVGKSFGFYASLRDNHENKRLASPGYLNQFLGAEYKVDGVSEQGDYSEMRGGLTYTWKWGSVGLIKDNFVWGDNYHGSNIFSGRTPSFAHLTLHIHPVKWLDFHYVHGWLVSQVLDSANIFVNNPGTRLNFQPKYLAANMATVTPWKNFNVSIGNSIIYSDKNIQPAYLVPFFFYKSIDHTLSGAGSNYLGENSQMYFNISSRQIKNVHLYTSFFIDEISFSNMFNSKTQSNIFSGKIGARVSNFMVQNLFLTVEYTRTNPIVYRHYVKTSTFASNLYNLGHYLGDNAQEIFLSAGYKPLAKLFVEASISVAQKGPEYAYDGQAGSGSGHGVPFLQYVYWQATEFAVKAQYQIINDCFINGGVTASDHHGIDVNSYTQPYFRGKRMTINIGANIGF